MSDWTLRLARVDDAPAMPAIERAAAALFAGRVELGNFDPEKTWSVPELARLIAKRHCLVAHLGDIMAGFLIAERFGRHLHLWEVSVAPEYQRRGIGAGLVRACLIDARNVGFAAVTLTTFRDLPWNEPFYAGLGFVEIDDHPRLNALLASEQQAGLALARRCAMICGLS